jgi:aminopeptidase N
MHPYRLHRSCGAAVLCLLTGLAGAAPFAFDSAPGRLPKDVVPVDYTIRVTPDIAAGTLAGHESVVVEVRRPTGSLTFNSLNERLSHVLFDGRPVARVASDDEAQLTVVTLASRAAPGRHVLSFDYTGKLEQTAQGLFVQHYRDAAGKDAVLLSTQMEATDARRLFPCWDEPAFRATFELTATVPAAWTVVGNMPVARRTVRGALATTTFQRSPRMPSYLVQYTAGDLGSIAGRGDGTPLAVYAVRGREQDGRVALENAALILADFNDYFGYRFPLPKLDSIAVPGGFQGAMENWGAITYNDQLLLLNPASTSAAAEEVFTIQAHEMAHQWFGDLVTMAWWDEIWLNESFASWMAARETALRHPDWKWWESEDQTKERAMRADSKVASHPIERRVTNELEVANSFDPEITYNKGQSVLRMFEAYLGPERFRAGVRAYMKDRAFSNATSTDLWNALGRASGEDVAAVASSWTTQPGFPLVSVAASCAADGARTLTLSQRRFLASGDDGGASAWSVPLRIRSGSADPVPVLLTRDGQTVAAGRCQTPLSVNADAVGYYRAEYDPATLEVNTAAFPQAVDGDRIALLDDEWALVGADRQPLARYLALASAMGESLNARAWEQIAGALGQVERAMRASPRHDEFAAYARRLLGVPFATLGWTAKSGETPDVGRLRRALIEGLGEFNDPAVTSEARRRFEAFLADRRSLPPDEQRLVLSIVARSADAATFGKLHALAREARDPAELERSYTALMTVRDPALAAEAATIALSPELPPEAEALRLALVSELRGEHPLLSWQVFTANHERLLAPSTSFAPLFLAGQVPAMYARGVPADEVERFVREKAPPTMAADVERGLESARFIVRRDADLRRGAEAYLH